MANYATLKAAIQSVIRQNGNNEITGALLQQSLLSMINSLGAYYQFAGLATPSTNPGTPDQNVCYLASTAGTYSNFGGIVLNSGEVAILAYNGSWTKYSSGFASQENLEQLNIKVSPYIVGRGNSGVWSDFMIPYPYAAGKAFRVSFESVDMTGITSAQYIRFGVFGIVNTTANYQEIAALRVTQELPEIFYFRVPSGKDYTHIAFLGRSANGTNLNFQIAECDANEDYPFFPDNHAEEDGEFQSFGTNKVFLNEILQSGIVYFPAANKASVGTKYTDLPTRTVSNDATHFYKTIKIKIPTGTKYVLYILGRVGQTQSLMVVDKDDYIINYDYRNPSDSNEARTMVIPPNADSLIMCVNLLLIILSTKRYMRFYSRGLDEKAKFAFKISECASKQLGFKGGWTYGGMNETTGEIVDFYPVNTSIKNTIRIRARISVPEGLKSIRIRVINMPSNMVLASSGGYYHGEFIEEALTDGEIVNDCIYYNISGFVDEVIIGLKKSDGSEITETEVQNCGWYLETRFSIFLGKKYCALGDSITYGYIPRNAPGYPGQLDSFAKIAAQRLGMSFQNFGISGSTVAAGSNPMSTRYADMPNDADLITVMGGTNDVRNGVQLGQFSDRDNTTFYGALHVLYQGLYSKYIGGVAPETGKNKKILVMTPIKLLDASKSSLANTIANNAEVLYQWDAWISAVKEVAAFYSFQVLDFYNLSGINPHLNRTVVGTVTGYTGNYNPYITDGTHPTQAGAEIMADVLVNYLTKNN